MADLDFGGDFLARVYRDTARIEFYIALTVDFTPDALLGPNLLRMFFCAG